MAVAFVAALPTAAESPGSTPTKGHVHYVTKARVRGEEVLARVTLAPEAAGKEKEHGSAVLHAMGAEEIEPAVVFPNGDPTDPSVTWSLVGSPWTTPLPATFSYNPASERVPGLAVFESALQMWTDVTTSELAYVSGGVTTACASLILQTCGGRPNDGKNVVAWGDIPAPHSNAIGVAYINSGGESDVLLNKNYSWATNCDNPSSGVAMLEVVTHEIGHSSGLGHAAALGQVMTQSELGQCELGAGDRAGVTYLYPQDRTVLTGVVRHVPSGVPLADATVFARPIGGPIDATATLTDTTAHPDGRYEISLPAPLRYELKAGGLGPGYSAVRPEFDADGSSATVDFEVAGPPPIVIEHASEVPEGGTARIAFTLPEAPAEQVDVEYVIQGVQVLPNGTSSGGSATDVPEIFGTATFAPGDVRAELPDVVLPQDELYEPSDAIRILLNRPIGPAGLSRQTAFVPVTDDDPINVSMLPASAREAEGPLRFELTANRESESPVDVTIVDMIDGTATHGLDYGDWITAGLGTDGHGVVEIPPFVDGVFEGPETFTLVVRVAGQQLQALGTIIDADDPDTDGDGIQDSGDPDDDNDGFSDEEENAAGSSTINANSTPEVCDGSDNDLDGVPDDGSPDADGDLIDDDCEQNSYTFEGFDAPVDNPPVLNVANAGRTIPVKFRLTNADGSPVSDPASVDSITSTKTSCSSADDGGTDTLEAYSGGSGLQYKGDGVWQFNWATPKSFGTSGGPCRQLTVTLADGTAHTANFRFK